MNLILSRHTSISDRVFKKSLTTITAFSVALSCHANVDPIDQCLLDKLKTVSGATRVSQIRAECDLEVQVEQQKRGALSNRFVNERATAFDPYVITPHRMNYILPITFTDSLNIDAYKNVDQWSENITDIESKFQLSIKVPLNYDDILLENDGLFFAMTLESWWQVYANNISKPFRETNYQPEIFYIAPLPWHPFGSNTGFLVGAEHQSNGRSQQLSRSWNRVYAGILMETDNFAMAIKPWIRLRENEKEFELDPKGDDNPDILDYMGHFEVTMAYKFDELEFIFEGRQNFARHKGGYKFGATFPFWGRLKGYVEYFTGYGNSLIEYNHKQQRIGIGIALTDIL